MSNIKHNTGISWFTVTWWKI